MRTIPLLPAEGRFYKANLHCHSTLSDGSLPPEQLKDIYKAQGYSILCMTDHELLVNHADLNDDDFLTLTGYELAVEQPGPGNWNRRKVCHINLYSPRTDYTQYVCCDPADFSDFQRRYIDPKDLPKEPYHRTYSPAGITEMVRLAHEAGFLCCYNHPTWSLEDATDYGGYCGFDMMEIVNYGCVTEGLDEYNTHAYDEMLRAGRRLSCVATDDNHNRYPLGDVHCDSFGGYTWIKVPALTYENVWQALRYGDFYASAGGPQLQVLEIRDGSVHLVCDGAKCIRMSTAGRVSVDRAATDTLLREETFPLVEEAGYIRFELIGPDGGRSFTRAYFLDELGL